MLLCSNTSHGEGSMVKWNLKFKDTGFCDVPKRTDTARAVPGMMSKTTSRSIGTSKAWKTSSTPSNPRRADRVAYRVQANGSGRLLRRRHGGGPKSASRIGIQGPRNEAYIKNHSPVIEYPRFLRYILTYTSYF
jgi:hypothetical protein